MEKRGETRIDRPCAHTLGRDKSGQPLAQEAVASSISESGAALWHYETCSTGRSTLGRTCGQKNACQSRLGQGLRITTTHSSCCTPRRCGAVSVVESVNSYFARTRRGAATRNRGRVKVRLTLGKFFQTRPTGPAIFPILLNDFCLSI